MMNKIDISVEHNGNGFDLVVDRNGDLAVTQSGRAPEVQAVIDDIVTILTTRIGSHPMHPDVGIKFDNFIGVPFSEGQAREMIAELYRAFADVVPRENIRIRCVQVTVYELVFFIDISLTGEFITLPFMFNVSDGIMEVGDLQ